MPRGHKPKRESKKVKKKASKLEVMPMPEFVSADVEVVKKRRKPKEEPE